MMRILFISSNIHTPWGGSELLWYKTAVFLLLHRPEVEVAVVARKWPSAPRHLQEIADAGGRIFDLPVPPATPLEYLRSKLRGALVEQKMSLMRKISPDLLVHSMGKSYEGGEWMKIAEELAVPYVNVVHLASSLQWPNDSEIDAYRDGYSRARCNYFVSQANRETVCRQLGMELANAAIVRNPIAVSREIVPYPETGQGYQCALPAMLVPIHKGQDILFDVLGQRKWRDRPLHLNLYGDGAYRRSLTLYAQYLGIEKVHFKGFADNIAEVWRKNHLLIMSSRMEGLPLTLIEAMSCGRPAVVTGVAGMKECIEDGRTGFIAASADPAALDDALERAWQARQDWQAMGVLAAAWVEELVPYEPAANFAEQLLGFRSGR